MRHDISNNTMVKVHGTKITVTYFIDGLGVPSWIESPDRLSGDGTALTDFLPRTFTFDVQEEIEAIKKKKLNSTFGKLYERETTKKDYLK